MWSRSRWNGGVGGNEGLVECGRFVHGETELCCDRLVVRGVRLEV
jgi:hypothetical protein